MPGAGAEHEYETKGILRDCLFVCLFVCYLGMKHRRQSMLLFLRLLPMKHVRFHYHNDDTSKYLKVHTVWIASCRCFSFVGTVINRHEKKERKEYRLSCVQIRTSERRPKNECLSIASPLFFRVREVGGKSLTTAGRKKGTPTKQLQRQQQEAVPLLTLRPSVIS
jgi:hypothetical protein